MPVLSNAKQEKFVQCLITGVSQRKAYLEAFPSSSRWKEVTIDNRASELFNSCEVLGRYQELQEGSANKAIMTAVERKVLLSKMAENADERTDTRIKAIDTLNKMECVYTNKVEMTGALELEITEKEKIMRMRLDELRKDE